MNWLYYLAEANLYLGVFYLAYCLLLNKETYYLLNRAYLLFSCGVSFVLPVVQIGALKPVNTAVTHTVAYVIPAQPQVVNTALTMSTVNPIVAAPIISKAVTTPVAHIATPIVTEQHFPVQYVLWYAYLAGAIILLLTLAIRLYHLFRLTRGKYIEQGEYKLVYLDGSGTAFSFFNYLFIGTLAPGTDTIIRHELVHIRQKHSADIIFLEVLKIMNWFNPCIYLLQNSLKTVHEYIADEQTLSDEADAHAYSSFLVDNAYGAGGIAITNSFFNYKLLKRRIIMLNQPRSGNWARLRYLVVIPLLVASLCVSTLAFGKTYALFDLAPAKIEQNTGSHKSGKLPIPPVIADDFPILDHYLHKTIHYRSGKGEKGGLVMVGFKLNKDQKITDVKIVKSAGSKLDALALNGFKSYKGIVNDDAGKNYKLGVYFFTNDDFPFTNHPSFDDPYIKDPEFVGELVIPNYDFVPAVTRKGYEYDEDIHDAWGGKIMTTRVVIYEKNNDAKLYYSSTATPGDIKLLKEKYGYVFPTNSYAGYDDRSFQIASYLDAPYTGDFYDYIFHHIKYPKKEKNDSVGGVVVLNFSNNDNGIINHVSVSQSGGHDFDEAAVNVLQSYKEPIKDKGGQYSIAIVFCDYAKKIRPVVSEKMKQNGYVGELAIGDDDYRSDQLK